MRVKALTDTVNPMTDEVIPTGMVLDVDPDAARVLLGDGHVERSREDLTTDVGALIDAHFDRVGRPEPRRVGPHG